jgi:methionyl-tRNA formyltransferase
MRAVLVGAVESTRVALKALAAAQNWEVPALITLPRELSKRHSDFVDLAPDAEAAGARLVAAPNSNAVEILDQVRDIAPDVTFVIGWSQICGRAFLDAASRRVVGYHPAPLPRLRGRAVIPWTILLDEKITASSLFWIDEGMDTGAIISQRYFHVAPDETAASLYARHMDALARMLPGVLDRLARGETSGQPQDERYASWAARRVADDGLIDWTRPADEIWRLVRAVGRPYPGAFTHFGDEKIVIWSAEPWPRAPHAASPGQVVAYEGEGFVVRCGDGGAVRVTAWEGCSGRMPRMHGRLGSG